MLQPLTLVIIIDRILYRTDGITQISVVSPTISGVDSCRLCDNESLSLKFPDVLGNGFLAHANCLTDGVVARIALKCFPIFAVHQVGIDGDLTEG